MVCWAQSQRLLWIAKQTEPFNRAHLAKAFNISIPQASKDISLFLKNSDAIKYDKRLKVYIPAPKTAEPETTPPRPAIKKLEWVMSREGGQIYHDAKTSFGTYSIQKQSGYWLYLGDDFLGDYDTLKAAISAAEAHKDKTIRECLV